MSVKPGLTCRFNHRTSTTQQKDGAEHILLTEYVARVYTQSIVVSMESRLILLGLLSAGPGHGYDLKRSWDHWFAASKPLAYGQVYATLARLVRDGLITQIETEPGAGPERKRYEVTDAGRQSVEQWLLTPVAPAGDVQADIFAKTVIALMLDDDAGRLLDLQRAEHMARMRELTRLKQDGDLRTVLLADHALFHIEADLRWMETTAARLGELRAEVRS